MQLGTPEDGSIYEMISIGDQLHIISENAIFAIQLADEIDPGRTNAAVPNANQKILSYGSRDPVVGRILLTARGLFTSSHLGLEFPEKLALKLALDVVRDIAAMLDMYTDLVNVTEAATKQILPNGDRSLALPAGSNAKNRCDSFAQKVGHVVDTMKEIARLFYPNELKTKWIDSLLRVTAPKHGNSNALYQFISEVRTELLFMRDIRNMIEHPKDTERIIVHDFRLTSEMTLAAPHIEILACNKSVQSEDLGTFMDDIIEKLLYIVETFIALICDENALPFGVFQIIVVELPEDRRPPQNPHQRFSYGINMNGRILPMG